MRAAASHWTRARLRLARRHARAWKARLPLLRRGLVRLALAAVAGVILLAARRSQLAAPEGTFLLRDRQGRFLGEVGEQGPQGEFGYWPLPALPPRVVAATLAVEDRRFWRHPGVDPLALARALRQNSSSGRRVSGASTLAMQVARMQQPGARSYARKLVEATTAFFLTLRHGREAVLAHYLRIVPYGNRIHGIAYAARRYLDKPVEDLSWAETAFLTAIPQAPRHMNPFLPSGRARAVKRGQQVLDLLLRDGALSPEEHELAQKQIVDLVVPPAGERPRSALHAILRFEELLSDPSLRARLADRRVLVTTLDLDVQDEVESATRAAVLGWESQGAGNAAVIVLDRASSQVLSWVGSADYFDRHHAGSIDFTRVPRSPGSTLKPFLYALALERGTIAPTSVLDDLERGGGNITNADELFLGPLLPRQALANSRNVPAANLLERIGLDEGYGFLRDLGLHDGLVPVRRYGLGLAIGALPVTLEHLVRAYTALGGDGQLSDLVWYEGQSRESHRVLSEDTARRIGLYLSDPQARLPSFARMGALEYPFPVAIKTGTSSRFRDAWAVAFTRRYLIGVWVGDPDFRPMNRLSGFRSAAELAQQVLLRLHPQDAAGLEDVSFPPPRGTHAVRLCALSGKRATAACERVTVEWLRADEDPGEDCEVHVRLAVDVRSGQPASLTTPPAYAEVRSFAVLPPRYATWAVAAGLPRLPAAAPLLRSDAPAPRISVTQPRTGLRLLRDPETPAEQATLALAAVVDPPQPQVVWYVDGAAWQLAEYPYTAHWPLTTGDHVFQARLPRGRAASSPVRVTIQ